MANLPIETETVEATPGLNPINPTSLTMTKGGLTPINPAGNGDANIDTSISEIAQNLKYQFPVADETQTAAGAVLKPGGPAETTV